MHRRLISKTISYLLLIVLIFLSWGYYQYQLKQIAKEKEILNQTFGEQQQMINTLKTKIGELEYTVDYEKFLQNNNNCAVSSCTFSRKQNLEVVKEINSGFIMVNGFQVSTPKTVQNEKIIQISTPPNLVPQTMLQDHNQLSINTFYLSNPEIALINSSTESTQVTIGIVITNQLGYAVFVKPL